MYLWIQLSEVGFQKSYVRFTISWNLKSWNTKINETPLYGSSLISKYLATTYIKEFSVHGRSMIRYLLYIKNFTYRTHLRIKIFFFKLHHQGKSSHHCTEMYLVKILSGYTFDHFISHLNISDIDKMRYKMVQGWNRVKVAATTWWGPFPCSHANLSRAHKYIIFSNSLVCVHASRVN